MCAIGCSEPHHMLFPSVRSNLEFNNWNRKKTNSNSSSDEEIKRYRTDLSLLNGCPLSGTYYQQMTCEIATFTWIKTQKSVQFWQWPWPISAPTQSWTHTLNGLHFAAYHAMSRRNGCWLWNDLSVCSRMCFTFHAPHRGSIVLHGTETMISKSIGRASCGRFVSMSI